VAAIAVNFNSLFNMKPTKETYEAFVEMLPALREKTAIAFNGKSPAFIVGFWKIEGKVLEDASGKKRKIDGFEFRLLPFSSGFERQKLMGGCIDADAFSDRGVFKILAIPELGGTSKSLAKYQEGLKEAVFTACIPSLSGFFRYIEVVEDLEPDRHPLLTVETIADTCNFFEQLLPGATKQPAGDRIQIAIHHANPHFMIAFWEEREFNLPEDTEPDPVLASKFITWPIDSGKEKPRILHGLAGKRVKSGRMSVVSLPKFGTRREDLRPYNETILMMKEMMSNRQLLERSETISMYEYGSRP
jgi:hypothetical protein